MRKMKVIKTNKMLKNSDGRKKKKEIEYSSYHDIDCDIDLHEAVEAYLSSVTYITVT